MRALFAFALLALCAAAVRGASTIETHVVYVQYFSDENRYLSDGQPLKLTAPTLHEDIEVIARYYKSAHEIITLLLASCTKHTTMPTDVEGEFGDKVEIPTYIFTFSEEDAMKLRLYAIADKPPGAVGVFGRQQQAPREQQTQQNLRKAQKAKKSQRPPEQWNVQGGSSPDAWATEPLPKDIPVPQQQDTRRWQPPPPPQLDQRGQYAQYAQTIDVEDQDDEQIYSYQQYA